MTAPTNSFWKWFALLLVVLNLTLLIFITTKPFRKNHARFEQHGPPPDRGGPARFIIEQLRFTKEQEAAFEILKTAHRDSIEMLQIQGRKLRNVFFENLRSDSSANTDALAQQIANNQLRIEMNTYRHFEAVKKLCTSEQKEKFNEIIQDVLQRMAPRPMPPGHPDGPPPPPEQERP